MTFGDVHTYDRLIERYGSPLFVYPMDQLRQRIRRLDAIRDLNVGIIYSIKANPNLSIVIEMLKHGVSVEVASIGELELALTTGFPSNKIYFIAPVKMREEIIYSIEKEAGVIVIDSWDELMSVMNIVEEINRPVRIGFRVQVESNRGVGLNMHRFGMTISEVASAIQMLRGHKKLVPTFLHSFPGGQILSEEIILSNFQLVVNAFIKISKATHWIPDSIDIGGGFGICYRQEDTELDVSVIAMGLRRIKEEAGLFSNSSWFIELGRFIIGPVGYYVTQVIARKTNGEKKVYFVNGGTHHVLSAQALGAVSALRRAVKVYPRGDEKDRKNVEAIICGPLCTPSDIVAHQYRGVECQVGDYVVIENAGAYALTGSPLLWLSRRPVKEVFVDNGGNYVVDDSDPFRERLKNQLRWFQNGPGKSDHLSFCCTGGSIVEVKKRV